MNICKGKVLFLENLTILLRSIRLKKARNDNWADRKFWETVKGLHKSRFLWSMVPLLVVRYKREVKIDSKEKPRRKEITWNKATSLSFPDSGTFLSSKCDPPSSAGTSTICGSGLASSIQENSGLL